MKKNNKNTITACVIVYNVEDMIERCLKSLRGYVDEILVIHDGPCHDKTLVKARKYTKNVFVRPRKGLMEGHLVFAYTRAKGDWILRIDADEFLPPKTQKVIRKLINDEKVDGYSLLFRIWDGKKYVTKDWPRKLCLFRKNKINFIEFCLQVEEIDGKVVESDYEVEHRPKTKQVTFGEIKTKHLRVAKKHALYNLMDFNKLERFGKPTLKFTTKLKKQFPILSIFPVFFLSLLKGLLSREMLIFKEKEVRECILFGAVYQIMVCYLIHKYKERGINNIKSIMDYSYLWGEKK